MFATVCAAWVNGPIPVIEVYLAKLGPRFVPAHSRPTKQSISHNHLIAEMSAYTMSLLEDILCYEHLSLSTHSSHHQVFK